MKQKCLVLLVILFAACGVLEAGGPRVVLVFGFENLSGNPNLGWMSEGIADLVANRLLSPARYVLPRQDRLAACEQLGLLPSTPLTLASEYKVSQTVGVNVAIVGTFTVKENQLTTTAQWLDVPGMRLSPPVVVSGKLQDLDDLETRLVWELLRLCDREAHPGSEEDFSRRFPPTRLDAFENYVRGILATDRKSIIHFLQESDRLDPEDHRAAFALGRYYFSQKDYADSAIWLKKPRAGDRDYPEALFVLGIDEYYLGDEQSAQKAFDVLAKQMPLGEIFNNLGVVEMRLGNLDQALADFGHAYQGDQTDPDFAFNMGVCLWSLKKYDRAAQYLRAALDAAPDDVEAHSLMADILGKLGFERGRSQELAWLAERRQEVDAGDDAASTGDAPAESNPNPRIKQTYEGRAFRLLAVAIRSAADAKLTHESPATVKDDGQLHLRQGLSLLSANRLPQAEHELVEAVSLLPASSTAHAALGRVYEAEGKHTLAATELEASLKQKDSAEAHLWLARAYFSLGHPEAAMQQAQAVLKLDPSNSEARQMVAQIIGHAPSGREQP
jgi:tetratricopeptide (TPR) repeat protein